MVGHPGRRVNPSPRHMSARLLAVIAAVFAAVGLLIGGGGTATAVASLPDAGSLPSYSHDAHGVRSVHASSHDERGPPSASRSYSAARAVDAPSNGDSVRPDGPASGRTTIYAIPTDLVQIAGGTAATPAPSRRYGTGATALERSGVAAETESSVYRGVSRAHPGYDDVQGNAIPRNVNGSTTAEAHNYGNAGDLADSPFTSWTRDPAIARRFAGDDGVILRLPTGKPPAGSTWKFEWSPDVWFEQEVLVRGPVYGAGRIQ